MPDVEDFDEGKEQAAQDPEPEEDGEPQPEQDKEGDLVVEAAGEEGQGHGQA